MAPRIRRTSASECGIEIEQGDDACFAIAKRGPLDEADLKAEVVVTEQPGLTLQRADERGSIAILERAHHLLHDKRLPRSGGFDVYEFERSFGDEIVDEGEASAALIDVRAEFRVEHDRSVEQERRDRLLLEAARDQERFVYGGHVVLVERGANGLEIAKSCAERDRARKQALSLEKL